MPSIYRLPTGHYCYIFWPPLPGMINFASSSATQTKPRDHLSLGNHAGDRCCFASLLVTAGAPALLPIQIDATGMVLYAGGRTGQDCRQTAIPRVLQDWNVLKMHDEMTYPIHFIDVMIVGHGLGSEGCFQPKDYAIS